MRKVGEFNDRDAAERFTGFLAKEKIVAELRDSGPGEFAVWVHDEDLLQVAAGYYDAFKANPDEPRFQVRRPPPEPAAPKPVRRSNYRQVQGKLQLTSALIAVSVIITILDRQLRMTDISRLFYYSEHLYGSFPEIREGQLWRLVTPIFLHGGWLHLIFNMMWLYQLGGVIEMLEGKRKLGLLVVVLAAVANTAQYLISGPNFVGMSGVVYGLLGYIWMMSKHSAKHRYEMPTQTVYFMLVWMVVCLVGIIGDVANAEHVAGFIAGTAWGFVNSGYIGAARRRNRYKNGS
jgi:GlpG protein